jgi:hypothetical protein
MIDNRLFPKYWNFVQRYCDAKHNGFGWDFSGASNTQELHDKLTSTIMLRRKKDEVLTELPAKMRSFVPLSLTNEKAYRHAERNFIDFISKEMDRKAESVEQEIKVEIEQLKSKYQTEGIEIGLPEMDRSKFMQEKQQKLQRISNAQTLVVEIEALKQLAVQGKLEQAIDWIDNFLSSGEKLVVFGVHKFVIDALMQRYGNIAVKIDGQCKHECKAKSR